MTVHNCSQRLRGGCRRLRGLFVVSLGYTLSSEPWAIPDIVTAPAVTHESRRAIPTPHPQSHQLLIPEPKIKNNTKEAHEPVQPATSSGNSCDGLVLASRLYTTPPVLTKGPLGSNFLWIRKACVIFLTGNYNGRRKVSDQHKKEAKQPAASLVWNSQVGL